LAEDKELKMLNTVAQMKSEIWGDRENFLKKILELK
jgi:hypothetical protein